MTTTTASPRPPVRERFGLKYRLRLVDGVRMFVCRTLLTDHEGRVGFYAMTEGGIYRGVVYPDSVTEVAS